MGQPESLGAFRTAPLRNVARTAPYEHNGQFPTLSEVLTFHLSRGAGAGTGVVGELDSKLVPVSLADADQANLLTFLTELTGPMPLLRMTIGRHARERG